MRAQDNPRTPARASHDDQPISANIRVHVHAPRPSQVTARDDGDCPALARDGRLCRGRRYILKYTEWYGLNAACFHCGACFGEDGHQTPGRTNVETVRREWREASA